MQSIQKKNPQRTRYIYYSRKTKQLLTDKLAREPGEKLV